MKTQQELYNLKIRYLQTHVILQKLHNLLPEVRQLQWFGTVQIQFLQKMKCLCTFGKIKRIRKETVAKVLQFDGTHGTIIIEMSFLMVKRVGFSFQWDYVTVVNYYFLDIDVK